jgi:hypothetical protein
MKPRQRHAAARGRCFRTDLSEHKKTANTGLSMDRGKPWLVTLRAYFFLRESETPGDSAALSLCKARLIPRSMGAKLQSIRVQRQASRDAFTISGISRSFWNAHAQRSRPGSFFISTLISRLPRETSPMERHANDVVRSKPDRPICKAGIGTDIPC